MYHVLVQVHYERLQHPPAKIFSFFSVGGIAVVRESSAILVGFLPSSKWAVDPPRRRTSSVSIVLAQCSTQHPLGVEDDRS